MDGYSSRTSKEYLNKKIDYKLNKKKIRVFTHKNIDDIKKIRVTGKSKFYLEKNDIIKNYKTKRHKFFKPKTKVGHNSKTH